MSVDKMQVDINNLENEFKKLGTCSITFYYHNSIQNMDYNNMYFEYKTYFIPTFPKCEYVVKVKEFMKENLPFYLQLHNNNRDHYKQLLVYNGDELFFTDTYDTQPKLTEKQKEYINVHNLLNVV